MKRDEKQKLAKLAKLENEKTSAFLLVKAKEIKQSISNSTNNDEIVEMLDTLESFAYRVPDVVVEIFDVVKATEHAPQLNISPIGNFRGKSYQDAAIKAIEVFGQIRYAKPVELLERLVPLVKKEGSSIGAKALDAVKSFAKYDYFILTKTKIGYGAQRKALDFVLRMKTEEQLSQFDAVETITRELLSTEIEGTEWTKEDTLTMHTGAVSPSDFLKKVRRETIDLVKQLYEATSDVKTRLRIVHILETAVRSPSTVAYGDDLAQMLAEDSRYVTGVFKDMLFSNGMTVSNSLAVAKEIDQLLYWFQRHSKYSSPEATQLRKDILGDPLYALFRILVSDDVTYREEEGWDTAEKKRSEKIQELLDSVTNESIAKWYPKLDIIASQNKVVENWTFLHFRDFLTTLASSKPEQAVKILDIAFEKSGSLKDFTGAFLEGFRQANNFAMWEKYVQVIVAEKNASLVSGITYSLLRFGDVGLKKEIRKEDLNLLKQIVDRSDDFAFLKKEKEKNFTLHHSIINAIASNYSVDPKSIEALLISEIKDNPDYVEVYMRELSFAVWRKYIDYSSFSAEGVEFMKEKLIDIRDLHWEAQHLLLDLGKKDLQIILDVFMGRIMHDVNQREDQRKDLDRTPHYDAIPHHLNDDLRKHVGEHPDYKEKVSKYLAESTPEWSVYNWNLGELIETIGTSFQDIVMTLVEKNDDESLRRAVYLMNSIEGADVGLLMEIVRRTDDKKVLSKIDALLYSTGVVTGEDGIARAYEAKAKQLEQFTSDPSPRVKKFAKRLVKSFKDSATREFKRAEEEKQIRKIEFEG